MGQQLPAPDAELELAPEALGHQVRPHRRVVATLADEHGQQIEAVHRDVVGDVLAGERRAGREEVGRARELIAHRPCGDHPRPARDERDAVSTLPAVALHPPAAARGVVVVVLAHPDGVQRLRPVVGMEDHEGLVVDAELLERVEEPARERVELADEVAPGPRIGRSFEAGRREDRRVADLGAEDEEEGLIRVLLTMLPHERGRLLEEEQVRVDEPVSLGLPALVVVPAPLAAGVRETVAPVPHGGRHRDHAVLDVEVERVRGGAVRRHEGLVEAHGLGPVHEGAALRVVDQERVLEAAAEALALGVEPGQPEMPLAEDPGAVARRLEGLGDREVLRRHVAGPARALERAAPAPGPRHDLPRDQAVPGRRADGRGAVGVREAHALGGHAIEPRRPVSGVRVVAGEVADPQVVRVDDHDVREVLSAGRRRDPDEAERDESGSGER